MGDRTAFAGYLHAVPKGKAKKVAGIFEEFGFSADWDSHHYNYWSAEQVRELVATGIQFTDDEFNCGSSGDVAKQLMALDVVFECHEDPKYEWLGEMHVFHPEVGHFSAECTGDGQAVITDGEVDNICALFEHPESIVVEIRNRLGLDFMKAFRKAMNG